MNREVPVQTWLCSYYLTSEKRWVPGKLSLTPTHLRFRQENTDNFLVSFHLSSINALKKESSSIIFSSITVLEKDQAKHWFSSFQPNRNVVFTVLEHFWREQLLPTGGEPGADSKTSTGKKLIGIASGSQKRMEDTGRVLHHQGEQFDNIMKGLNKIESDMATTDRMLSVLESPAWWPFSGSPWKKTAQNKESAPCGQNRGKEGVIASIPIVFSSHSDPNLKLGKLTVLLSALEISDCNLQLHHRYEHRDVDDIRVFTGHEISVRQRFIGKPDIAYRILSAKLPDILPILEMQFKRKVEFQKDAVTFSEMWRGSPEHHSPGWETESLYLDAIVRSGPCVGGGSEAVTQEQEVSESEVRELRKILMKLKSIALDAEDELGRHDEALDEINSSTDRAVLTMDKQTRRMRKLL